MITELDRLAELRPPEVAPLSAAARDDLMARIVATPTTTRLGARRRPVFLATAAALVAGLLVAGLAGVDEHGNGTAAAAVIDRLATSAGRVPLVGSRQYAYQATSGFENRDYQDQRSIHSSAVLTWTRDQWTSPDGHVWFRTNRRPGPSCESVPFSGPPSLDNPTAAYLANLPTSTTAMAAFLQTHATGATSRDEAVFFAVHSVIVSGLAPRAMRAAALHVLARTGHISVKATAHDSLGRPAVQVDFVDGVNRPGEVQSDFFDPTTADIEQSQVHRDGRLVYQEVTTASSIVDEVPPLRC